LRLAETCGMRPEDVDFMRAVVHPHVQYPCEPLKTKTSRAPVPIPASLAAELSAQIVKYARHGTLLTGRDGHQLSPWAVERAMRTARKKVPDLPAGFRYHDLRHYLRACSLPRALMSRPFRHDCAMPALRPRSTLTATSGPTGTRRLAPPSRPSSLPGRNSGGTATTQTGNGAGHDPSSGQTS
jgi:integrase